MAVSISPSISPSVSPSSSISPSISPSVSPSSSISPSVSPSPSPEQPQSTNSLDSPDHALSHRVFANNPSAPVKSITVDNSGNIGINNVGPEARLDVKGGGADILNLRNSSGTKKVTVLENGNVGIGTTAPAGKLEVAGKIVGTSLRVNQATDDVGGGLTLYDSAIAYGGGIFREAGANGNLVFRNQGINTVNINNGNVGVGTTGPGAKLVITDGSSFSDFAFKPATSAVGITSGVTFRTNGNGYGYIDTYKGTTLGYNTANGASGNDFWIKHGSAANTVLTITGGTTYGNVGIGTTNPTNLLSLGGNAARIFWMERHITANTAGNTLTITAGGATSAATDKAGGALILQGGLSTGSAESGVTIQGCVAGVSGTADRTQTTEIQVLGSKIGFYGVTPIARAVLATGVGATVDNVITALQNLGLVSQS